MSKICKNCGAEMYAFESRCTQCGFDNTDPKEIEIARMKEKKRKRKMIIIGVVIAVAVIAAVIGIIFLVQTIQKSAEQNRERENKSLSVLVTTCRGYQRVPDAYNVSSGTLNEDDRPDKIKNYVIVRIKDEDDSALRDISGQELMWDPDACPDFEDRTITEENVEKLDVIVLAVSNYRTASYSGGGRYAKFSSEDVDLYYYNPKTDTFFCTDRIKGKDLPEIKPKSLDYTIDDSDIKDRIAEELDIEKSEGSRTVGTIIFVTIVAVIGLLVLALGVIKLAELKKERKK